MMMNKRLSMNGVFPMMLPVSGSRSGAPGRKVASTTTKTTASRPNSAHLEPRLSASTGMAAASVWSSWPGSGTQGPRRGSTIRSVTSAATSASTNDITTMK